MSTALQGRIAIRARQVKPGEAYAVEVKSGQLIQITDVSGKQVADFVAFNSDNRAEHLSVSATRTVSSSIMLQQGMQLVSNRRAPMFELVEDTVGRHDMLLALCDRPEPEPLETPAATPEPEPVAAAEPAEEPAEAPADATPTDDVAAEAEQDGASPDTESPTEAAEEPAATPEPAAAAPASCLTAIGRALDSYGIAADQIPDPINWFMNVGIKGRGELEVREPLSERNDFVVLSVLMDSIVAVTACSQSDDATNGEQPTDILVRVYR